MSVLSAFELNSALIEKSHQLDIDLDAYRVFNLRWADAENASRKAQAQAYAFNKGKTVSEKQALVNIECDEEISAALLLESQRTVASKALDVHGKQLSALQSVASALREELKMARTAPEGAFS